MFGLSYANYLVWPRLFMQDMPADWQERFCALADEYNARFADLEAEQYEVNLLAREPQLITVYERACPTCGEEGTVTDDDGEEKDCPTCDGVGADPDSDDQRYETADEVGRRPDWRSDYRHGQPGLRRRLAEVAEETR